MRVSSERVSGLGCGVQGVMFGVRVYGFCPATLCKCNMPENFHCKDHG